ncbi:conserved Plasmodium protein, unknown function [Plasmodium sp. DRC-Itaito]|nr:conserved Plasmodium protein, unknown function [Plasmodium sp. DRC-Itaito]
MKKHLGSSSVFKKPSIILCCPLSFSISRQSFFFFSYKSHVAIPHFFKNDSGGLVEVKQKKILFCEEGKILEKGRDVKYTLTKNVHNINEEEKILEKGRDLKYTLTNNVHNINEEEKILEKGRDLKYTLTNNIHNINEEDFYKRLIRTYVDILFNYYKYPLHIQCLHILSKNLLKEKIRNVTQSKEHKRKVFPQINNEYGVEDLNKFLVHINNHLSTNNCYDMNIINKDNIIKKINNFLLNYKNILYAIFTFEHNKVIFHYTENILINDLKNCFISSYLNKNKDIYRFINKYGHDNIYIYILEYAENIHILKKRFFLVKNLFFNKEM